MNTQTDTRTKQELEQRVVELDQQIADEQARATELAQKLADTKGVSMIAAVAERVIKATDRIMGACTDGETGEIMNIITSGQKQLAFISSRTAVDIYHKMNVCLQTNDIHETAEELSAIEAYLAALQSGQLAVVMENHNCVMDVCFRAVKQAADSGYSDTDWDNLVKSVCYDSYILLMTKAYYF